MRGRSLVITVCALGISGIAVLQAEAIETSDIRLPAEQAAVGSVSGRYPSDRYVIGHGSGDLTKGPFVCRRVAELAARTDVAKQIHVTVKERMADRVRERSGREPEQDIELTREEMVQEYLQGVRIVDYRIDEGTKTYSAIAVMAKE